MSDQSKPPALELAIDLTTPPPLELAVAPPASVRRKRRAPMSYGPPPALMHKSEELEGAADFLRTTSPQQDFGIKDFVEGNYPQLESSRDLSEGQHEMIEEEISQQQPIPTPVLSDGTRAGSNWVNDDYTFGGTVGSMFRSFAGQALYGMQEGVLNTAGAVVDVLTDPMIKAPAPRQDHPESKSWGVGGSWGPETEQPKWAKDTVKWLNEASDWHTKIKNGLIGHNQPDAPFYYHLAQVSGSAMASLGHAYMMAGVGYGLTGSKAIAAKVGGYGLGIVEASPVYRKAVEGYVRQGVPIAQAKVQAFGNFAVESYLIGKLETLSLGAMLGQKAGRPIVNTMKRMLVEGTTEVAQAVVQIGDRVATYERDRYFSEDKRIQAKHLATIWPEIRDSFLGVLLPAMIGGGGNNLYYSVQDEMAKGLRKMDPKMPAKDVEEKSAIQANLTLSSLKILIDARNEKSREIAKLTSEDMSLEELKKIVDAKYGPTKKPRSREKLLSEFLRWWESDLKKKSEKDFKMLAKHPEQLKQQIENLFRDSTTSAQDVISSRTHYIVTNGMLETKRLGEFVEVLDIVNREYVTVKFSDGNVTQLSFRNLRPVVAELSGNVSFFIGAMDELDKQKKRKVERKIKRSVSIGQSNLLKAAPTWGVKDGKIKTPSQARARQAMIRKDKTYGKDAEAAAEAYWEAYKQESGHVSKSDGKVGLKEKEDALKGIYDATVAEHEALRKIQDETREKHSTQLDEKLRALGYPQQAFDRRLEQLDTIFFRRSVGGVRTYEGTLTGNGKLDSGVFKYEFTYEEEDGTEKTEYVAPGFLRVADDNLGEILKETEIVTEEPSPELTQAQAEVALAKIEEMKKRRKKKPKKTVRKKMKSEPAKSAEELTQEKADEALKILKEMRVKKGEEYDAEQMTDEEIAEYSAEMDQLAEDMAAEKEKQKESVPLGEVLQEADDESVVSESPIADRDMTPEEQAEFDREMENDSILEPLSKKPQIGRQRYNAIADAVEPGLQDRVQGLQNKKHLFTEEELDSLLDFVSSMEEGLTVKDVARQVGIQNLFNHEKVDVGVTKQTVAPGSQFSPHAESLSHKLKDAQDVLDLIPRESYLAELQVFIESGRDQTSHEFNKWLVETFPEFDLLEEQNKESFLFLADELHIGMQEQAKMGQEFYQAHQQLLRKAFVRQRTEAFDLAAEAVDIPEVTERKDFAHENIIKESFLRFPMANAELTIKAAQEAVDAAMSGYGETKNQVLDYLKKSGKRISESELVEKFKGNNQIVQIQEDIAHRKQQLETIREKLIMPESMTLKMQHAKAYRAVLAQGEKENWSDATLKGEVEKLGKSFDFRYQDIHDGRTRDDLVRLKTQFEAEIENGLDEIYDMANEDKVTPKGITQMLQELTADGKLDVTLKGRTPQYKYQKKPANNKTATGKAPVANAQHLQMEVLALETSISDMQDQLQVLITQDEESQEPDNELKDQIEELDQDILDDKVMLAKQKGLLEDAQSVLRQTSKEIIPEGRSQVFRDTEGNTILWFDDLKYQVELSSGSIQKNVGVMSGKELWDMYLDPNIKVSDFLSNPKPMFDTESQRARYDRIHKAWRKMGQKEKALEQWVAEQSASPTTFGLLADPKAFINLFPYLADLESHVGKTPLYGGLPVPAFQSLAHLGNGYSAFMIKKSCRSMANWFNRFGSLEDLDIAKGTNIARKLLGMGQSRVISHEQVIQALMEHRKSGGMLYGMTPEMAIKLTEIRSMRNVEGEGRVVAETDFEKYLERAFDSWFKDDSELAESMGVPMWPASEKSRLRNKKMELYGELGWVIQEDGTYGPKNPKLMLSDNQRKLAQEVDGIDVLLTALEQFEYFPAMIIQGTFDKNYKHGSRRALLSDFKNWMRKKDYYSVEDWKGFCKENQYKPELHIDVLAAYHRVGVLTAAREHYGWESMKDEPTVCRQKDHTPNKMIEEITGDIAKLKRGVENTEDPLEKKAFKRDLKNRQAEYHKMLMEGEGELWTEMPNVWEFNPTKNLDGKEWYVHPAFAMAYSQMNKPSLGEMAQMHGPVHYQGQSNWMTTRQALNFTKRIKFFLPQIMAGNNLAQAWYYGGPAMLLHGQEMLVTPTNYTKYMMRGHKHYMNKSNLFYAALFAGVIGTAPFNLKDIHLRDMVRSMNRAESELHKTHPHISNGLATLEYWFGDSLKTVGGRVKHGNPLPLLDAISHFTWTIDAQQRLAGLDYLVNNGWSLDGPVHYGKKTGALQLIKDVHVDYARLPKLLNESLSYFFLTPTYRTQVIRNQALMIMHPKRRWPQLANYALFKLITAAIAYAMGFRAENAYKYMRERINDAGHKITEHLVIPGTPLGEGSRWYERLFKPLSEGDLKRASMQWYYTYSAVVPHILMDLGKQTDYRGKPFSSGGSWRTVAAEQAVFILGEVYAPVNWTRRMFEKDSDWLEGALAFMAVTYYTDRKYFSKSVWIKSKTRDELKSYLYDCWSGKKNPTPENKRAQIRRIREKGKAEFRQAKEDDALTRANRLKQERLGGKR